MKRFVILVCLLLVGLMACNTLTEPEDPIPACEQNNTATVSFENRSVTNRSYDIVWDGVHIATIGPWEKTKVFTVSTGKHKLDFKVSNSGDKACSTSWPVLSRCEAYSWFCTG